MKFSSRFVTKPGAIEPGNFLVELGRAIKYALRAYIMPGLNRVLSGQVNLGATGPT